MKAITIYQPYSSLIVSGIKTIETRPRRTNIRGRVAIHAGQRDAYLTMKKLSEEVRKEIFAIQHENARSNKPYCYGAVIGTVEIVDCVPIEEVLKDISNRERLLGDYSSGRYAWILKNPIMFDKAIKAKGQQGWWEWDAVTIKKYSAMGKTEATFEFVE